MPKIVTDIADVFGTLTRVTADSSGKSAVKETIDVERCCRPVTVPPTEDRILTLLMTNAVSDDHDETATAVDPTRK